MKFFRTLSSDGRLSLVHDSLEETGDRPRYLLESYTSRRNAQREADRLSLIGYRIQSLRRKATLWEIMFEHMGEQ